MDDQLNLWMHDSGITDIAAMDMYWVLIYRNLQRGRSINLHQPSDRVPWCIEHQKTGTKYQKDQTKEI